MTSAWAARQQAECAIAVAHTSITIELEARPRIQSPVST